MTEKNYNNFLKLSEDANILREIFINSRDAIGVSKRGVHLLTNPAYLKLFGYSSSEEVNGRPIFDFIHPDSHKMIKEYVERRANGLDAPNQYIIKGLRKDGSVFDMEVSVSAYKSNNEVYTLVNIRDVTEIKLTEQNNKKYILVTAEDITERKKLEEESQGRQTFIENLLESMQDGLSVIRLDGVRIMVNQALVNMTGFSKEELLNKPPPFPFWPSEEIGTIQHEFDKLLKGDLKEIELTFMRKSGERFPILLTPSYVRDEKGEVKYFMVLIKDITSRKRIEEALRESEYFFKESQRAAFIGSYKTDFTTGAWESSEVLNQIFGIGKNYDRSVQGWLEIVHPDDREMMEKYLREEVISKKKPFNKEYRIIRKSDGEVRWVNGLGEVGLDIEGNVILMIGTIQDITERKKIENILKNTQNLESLGILAGGIAHDFNNLMSGIFGYVELASMTSDSEKRSEYLRNAMSALDRARGLTAQLLTFAKGGAPVQSVIPLTPFLEETVQFALSGSNCSARFEIPDNIWNCNIDKNQISQVIDNIAINAQQAMPGGGTILVSAENISLKHRGYLNLSEGDFVKISIRDNGIGMSKDMITHIFDPFYTTKTKGHGLGLTTSHSIINRHSGIIDVTSTPGKGSTFHLYLPGFKETVVQAESRLVKHKGGKGTVIVMDDEAIILKTTIPMLESLGYAVVCKSNGSDALDFFKEEIAANRPVSFLIFDLTIRGGMGGKEAGQEVRKIDRDIPVFVISGYAEDPVMKNPAEYGFTASLSKPFIIGDIAKMLERYL